MIHKLTLTNEQAITLYNVIQNKNLDRGKNRNRWKFLEVIEDKVFAFENDRETKVDIVTQARQEAALKQTDQNATYDEKVAKNKEIQELVKKLQQEMKDLAKQTNTFEFNDREVFVQGKAFFDMSSISASDPAKPEELKGQDSKIIKEIEDAFLNAQTAEAQPSQPAAIAPKEAVN